LFIFRTDIESNDAIIFIHGGAFTLCDSADLLIGEGLLPLFEDKTLSMYSILYDTAPSAKPTNGSLSQPAYQRIHLEVFEAYEKVRATGKNVICIMGDSAGGALVINLMLQIQEQQKQQELKQKRHNISTLCLLSPWIHFTSSKPSHSNNKKYDLIDETWLSKSKYQYLGKELYRKDERYHKELRAIKLTQQFISNGVKVVVFDIDQCIATTHSMGRLKRSNLSKFVDTIRDDFVIFSKVLHKAGMKLAIATHSDELQNNYFNSEATHIIGQELVETFLSITVPEIKQYFKIIVYRDNDPKKAHKKYHMSGIASLYDVSSKDCVLFDDNQGNVNDTEGLFNTYKVNVGEGSRLNPFLLNQINMKPFTSSGGGGSYNSNPNPNDMVSSASSIVNSNPSNNEMADRERKY
jgi:hypothetical protein